MGLTLFHVLASFKNPPGTTRETDDMRSWRFDLISPEIHDQTRQLVLDGLAEHWGELDPTLNPDLDDMLSSYASGKTIVVTTIDAPDRIIGTGTVVPRGSQKAEIARMSVAPEHRRAGLGRAIVAHLEDLAKTSGHERVILETTSAWSEVVAFYLRCGYTITHTEQSDFGEDTWFEKTL